MQDIGLKKSPYRYFQVHAHIHVSINTLTPIYRYTKALMRCGAARTIALRRGVRAGAVGARSSRAVGARQLRQALVRVACALNTL